MRSIEVDPDRTRPAVDRQEAKRIVARARRARAVFWRGLVRGTIAGVIRHLRDHWIEPVGRWRRQRADLKALSALDARMLDDIGLEPADLRAVAAGVLPVTRAVARRAAAQVDRVGTVTPFPARKSWPRTDGNLDVAA